MARLRVNARLACHNLANSFHGALGAYSKGDLMKSQSWLATALMIALVRGWCGQALADADPAPIVLETGHSTVLRLQGLTRVAVGDSAIAGVVPVGTTQLIINAKNPGYTSVFAWTGSTRHVYEIRVTNQVLDGLAQMLRIAISEPDVQVVSFVHAIVVRGTVPDMAHYVDLSNLVDRFTELGKKNDYTIVNAVTVAHSFRTLEDDFDSKTIQDLQIEPDGKGNVIVSGRVKDGTQAAQVLEAAKETAGPYLSADGKIVDRLQRLSATQISIKVYVLEVDNTGASDLGIQLQAGTPNPTQPNQISLGTPSFPILEAPNASGYGKAFNIGGFYRTTILAPTLNLALQSGHARILSEPNLVTMPGEKATFLVGGQIPYVYSTGLGQVSIEFKPYGVQLNVTPQLLPNGDVDSAINPDISNLDYTNAVELNGFYIPALKESSLSTELVTKPGESIVMGGLVERVETKTIQKIPLLSSLPILGQLFQSTSYQKQDTDVVFVMTPEIINQ
jgi:pilus assembly protein CpaC